MLLYCSCHIYHIICLKSVDVRRMQLEILAQSPPEMSQTDRILPRYFLSRVRVSIRPRIFYTTKNPEPVARSPTGPVAYFSATDRQNGAIWKAVYTFTPGGDLRHNSHKMSASAMDGLLAPRQNHPRLRESYPLCSDPAKHGSDPAKRGSVCEAFDRKPLYRPLRVLGLA